MKRVIFIISIILLGGLGAYLYLFRNKGTFNSFGSHFALSDPSEVTRIIIENNFDTCILVKQTREWKINNRTAAPQTIADALFLAGHIETIAPAPLKFADSITNCLQSGTNVSFYKGHKLIKAFTLCKFKEALYARKSGSRKDFRISVRGHSNVDLTAIFTTNILSWRENIIIDFAPRNINQISVTYPASDKSGFILQMDENGHPNLFTEKMNPVKQELLPDRVQEYLHFFTDIRYNKVEENHLEKAVLKNRLPFCKISIITRNSDKKIIEGYTKINLETGRSDHAGFYAVDPELGTVFLSYNDFDPILVEQDYFLKN
jgi:hypothetical protein